MPCPATRLARVNAKDINRERLYILAGENQGLTDAALAHEQERVHGVKLSRRSITQYRKELLGAAPRLTALLKLSQPESSGLAFTLLGILSMKSYDRRDLAAWDAWAAGAAAGKP